MVISEISVKRHNYHLGIKLLFLTLAILLNAILFFNLFIDSSLVNLLFKRFFGVVCHQSPEKTLTIPGLTFIVCSRCSGIYSGFLISTLFSALMHEKSKNISLKILYLASLPMITDIMLVQLGIMNYSLTSAFISGLVFSFFAYLFFIENFKQYLGKKFE